MRLLILDEPAVSFYLRRQAFKAFVSTLNSPIKITLKFFTFNCRIADGNNPLKPSCFRLKDGWRKIFQYIARKQKGFFPLFSVAAAKTDTKTNFIHY